VVDGAESQGDGRRLGSGAPDAAAASDTCSGDGRAWPHDTTEGGTQPNDGDESGAVEQPSAAAPPPPATSPQPAPVARCRPSDALAQSAAERAALAAGDGAPGAAAARGASSELRARVAWLELQLERALRAREAAEQQLLDAAAQRDGERAWREARLADREREAALLRSKAAALEAAAASQPHAASHGGGGDGAQAGGGGHAAAAASQDAALLQAYQRENEAAARRIKVGASARSRVQAVPSPACALHLRCKARTMAQLSGTSLLLCRLSAAPKRPTTPRLWPSPRSWSSS
jgi:hypothetical protein